MSDILNIVLPILVGMLIILGLVLLWNAVRRAQARAKAGGQVGIQAVLDALEPFIWRGILAGEQLALKGMNDLDVTLTGWDKAAIANAIYDLIPDTIMVGDRSVPVKLVKALVPRQAFIAAVKDIYDAAHAFVLQNEGYLINQVAALKEAMQGSAPAQSSLPDLRAILPPGETG